MSWYRRRRQAGGLYCFTVVTYDRRRFLTGPDARDYLKAAIQRTRADHPFESVAVVLLPDHLHCIWQLPPHNSGFSMRWRLIKTRFTRRWLQGKPRTTAPNQSRRKHGERTVWQRRFWEHLIRDEADFKRHLDYIHYNPVKHGYVNRAGEWAYSTFAKFVALGEYEGDWGQGEPESLRNWLPKIK